MIHVAAVSHGVGGPVHLVEAVVRQLAGLVTVPAKEGRQPHAPDLPQLREAEAEARVPGLVPEPVALPQVAELDADDAGEGGADESALQGALAQAAREEVDVVHVIVHLFNKLRCSKDIFALYANSLFNLVSLSHLDPLNKAYVYPLI